MAVFIHEPGAGSPQRSTPVWSCVCLALLMLSALLASAPALAQPGGQNFLFTGYVEFRNDATDEIHRLEFEDYGLWGQNVPLPYYESTNVGGEDHVAPNPLFHLSCSDPLIDKKAVVNLARTPGLDLFAGKNPPLSEPPFEDDQVVTIVDFFSQRRNIISNGVSTCGTGSPEVTKTAVSSFDREYEWEITKTASPESADIFFGDTQEFGFSVHVAATGFDDINHALSGIITARNTLDEPITVTAVTDMFPGMDTDTLVITCAPEIPMDGLMLSPNAEEPQLSCTYAADSDGTAGTNTATVTYNQGDLIGRTAQAQAAFDFTGDPANEINETVNVSDSFDGADPATAIGSCSATDEDGCTLTPPAQTLACGDIDAENSGDSGSKTNVATIDETGDYADATVTLTCHRIDVTKTADTSFSREFFWTVSKNLDDEEPVRFAEGQYEKLSYTISVDLDDPASMDGDFKVAGTITISNPAPVPAVINTVADNFPGGSDIDVDCGEGESPYEVPAATGEGEEFAPGELECSYSGDSDGTAGTNTATATQQHFAFPADPEDMPEELGTSTHSGTAAFDFDGDPSVVINGCVDVYDLLSIEGEEFDPALLIAEDADAADPSVCVNEDLELPEPASFEFMTESMVWFEEGDSQLEEPICEIEVSNTAAVFEFDRESEDPALLASDTVETTVFNADCVFGCTLTIGYWKTHSFFGPAPYDTNWQRVGNDDPDESLWTALDFVDVCDPEDGAVDSCGEDTAFFGRDQSWLEVLWTPPAGGNAYYILGHQFIAATLNVLNGADDSAISEAWAEAKGLLEGCGPDDFNQGRRGRNGTPAGSCADDRDQAVYLAGILDDYNNGLIGPGKCTSDDYDD